MNCSPTSVPALAPASHITLTQPTSHLGSFHHLIIAFTYIRCVAFRSGRFLKYH